MAAGSRCLIDWKNMVEQQTLEWKLARLAHEEWCARMSRAGWRQGRVFDPELKLHDALVPFDELSPVDRRSVYVGIVMAEVTKEIEEACEYSRGDDRELSAADVARELRVRHVDQPSELGRIEAWGEDPKFPGALNWIRVQWDSGEVIEHAAPEREVSMADAASAR